MENYDLEKEKKTHPYEYYGIVFEETHNNTRFLMRSALNYVVDACDPYLGSVELSHYEKLNYNEVIDFNQPVEETFLDLTWMNKEDVFKLRKSEQYLSLEEISVNIDNLGYSTLPSGNDKYNLRINALNSKSNYVQQIKAFINFISNNKVNFITLNGFNRIVESILTLYANKAGIIVNNHDLTDNNQKRIKREKRL